jgi:peptidoglycan/LPS O-acetylase OafA/YrhL
MGPSGEMCFNAEVSFAAAGVVGAVGVAGLRYVRHPSDLLLAGLPLAFAAHQLSEGITWRLLDADDAMSCTGPSVRAWVLFAWVLLPVWIPLTVALAEPDAARRRSMLWLLALAVAVAPLWAGQALAPDVHAARADWSLEYPMPDTGLSWLVVVYVLVTLVPPLRSSWPWLRAIGVTGAVMAAVALVANWWAWPSLWCFGAALVSVLVVGHLASREDARLTAWRGGRLERTSARPERSPQTTDGPSQ